MKQLVLTILILTFAVLGQSQSYNILKNTKVEVSKAKKVGKTEQIRDLISRPQTSKEKRQTIKTTKLRPNNFVGRKRGSKVLYPELEHQGPDKVRQSQFNFQSVDPKILVNIDGIDIGSSPHDPSGDIGKDHYVQGINVTEIGVFTKEGVLLQQFSANTLWQPLGFSSAGDPIVLYDQEFDRWYFTEFPDPNELLIAVSESSDPLGAYNVYNFSTPQFPDYPKYGLWNNALTVTSNEGSPNNLTVYALDRDALLAGEDEVDMQRLTVPGSNNTEAGFFVATPVDWTGDIKPEQGTGPYVLRINDSSWGDVDDDQIEIYELQIDFTNSSNTQVVNTSIVTSPFDGNPCAESGFGFQCIPQKDGGGIDGIPEVIMNQAHYRNFETHQSMVFNFITDATDGNNVSGIRWVELRKTIGSSWSLYQEGTFAPDDGLHRFMGGICMDGNGNIALAYNVSGEEDYPGIRFTGRTSSDPLGEMTIPEQTVVEGKNASNAGGRFGDYAQMGVDPINDKTFWYTSEYGAGGLGGAKTRIFAFEIQKDTFDLAVRKINSPSDNSGLNSEAVVIEVKNEGIEGVSSYEVGYSFENGPQIIEQVDSLISPDEIYVHTFSSEVTFADIGEYKIKAFVHLGLDQNKGNDTLFKTTSKLPFVDLELLSITPEKDQICEDSTYFTVVFRNNGTNIIDSFEMRTLYNNTLDIDTIYMSIGLGQTAEVTYPVTMLMDGNNTIEITASTFEGMIDETPTNNEGNSTLSYNKNSETFTLDLLTDDYPEETSWTLTTENGILIAASNSFPDPLSNYISQFCLNKDSCYIFQINDTFGDGLLGDIGDGNYSITNSQNEIVASLLEVDFGYNEVNEFCGIIKCNLEVNISISDISSSGLQDGILLLEPQNGTGPFTYSIDGGVTFQAENIFTGLPKGIYPIVVKGAEDCLFESSIEINICAMDLLAETINASSSTNNDGRIVINISNGTQPYFYSIDGGLNFQSSNVFDGLGTGYYTILVKDNNDCEKSMEGFVDFTSSIHTTSYGLNIKVAPNPTSGMFTIEVAGYQHKDYKIFASVFDLQGKRVRTSSLYKYNDKYKGEFSITSLPTNTYLVKIEIPGYNKLLKVVKVN